MSSKHHLPQRRSPRLQGYDYTNEGAYFITICTDKRAMLFGNIISDEMILSHFGELAYQYWQSIPEHFLNVELDMFVVMPNHIHGILVIMDSSNDYTPEQYGKPVQGSIPTVVRSYKSIVTREINKARNTKGDKVWQSRFYDHIIRNQGYLNKIREYVLYNPKLWKKDVFHPMNASDRWF